MFREVGAYLLPLSLISSICYDDRSCFARLSQFFGHRTAEELIREMHRAAEQMQRGPGMGPFGMGMTPEEWERMARSAFGSSRGTFSASEVGRQVREHVYRSSDGRQFRRRVIRRHLSDGSVEESVEDIPLSDGRASESPSGAGGSGIHHDPRVSRFGQELIESVRRTIVPMLSWAFVKFVQGAVRSFIRRLLRGRRF